MADDDIMIIDKENTPSPSPTKKLKQQSKQMTLFGWATKSSKPSEKKNENERISTSSSKPIPEEETKVKKVLGAKNENQAAAKQPKSDEIMTIDDDDDDDNMKKDENEKKKIVSKSKPKKAKNKSETSQVDKSDEAMTIDDKNDSMKKDENKTPIRKNSLFNYFGSESQKKSEIKEIKKDSAETKEVQNKPKPEETILTKSVEVTKKPQLTITDLIKQHGRQPFNFDSSSSVNSSHFGDLLQIVEQYNTWMPLLFNDFLSRTEIGFKKIKYTSLVKSLSQNSSVGSQEAKNYYLDIIRRFLMIFIYYEEIFPKPDYYMLDFTKIGLKSHLIQELTRITLNVLLYQPNFNDIDMLKASGFDIMRPSKSILNFFGVMKKLEMNHSNEPFGELTVGEKLDILRIFCDQMLMSKAFQEATKRREEEIVNLKALVNDQEEALAAKLELTLPEFRANKAKYFNEILDSNLAKFYHRKKVVKSIIESREKLEKLKSWSLIKEPGFKDPKWNSYWRFAFINELVVEIAKEDPNEPVEWYLFDLDNTKQLIDDLQMRFEYREVRQKLLEVYKEQQKSAAAAKEDDGGKPKQMRRADEILGELTATDESEGEEEEEEEQKQRMTRRKLTRRGGKKEKIFEVPELYSFKGIDFESDYFYSIDEMALNLANLFRYMIHYGFIRNSYYANLKQMILDYRKAADFETKFKLVKALILDIYEHVNHKFKNRVFIYHATHKFRYNGEIKMLQGVVSGTTDCQSISQLYFFLYHFLANVMMDDCENQKCAKCRKDILPKKYKRIESLEKISDDDETNEVEFHVCLRCPSYYHMGCDEGYKTRSGENWICSSCKKVAPYEYELIDEEKENAGDAMKDAEILIDDDEEEDEQNPARTKLRQTTKNSKINFEPYFTNKPVKQKKHDTSNSSVATTNTSVSSASNESLVNNQRRSSARNRRAQRKNMRDSSVSSIEEEPMRKSERISSRSSSNKKINYVIESDDEDDF